MALRNLDYSDRELLHVIYDATGGDGLASSDDIAAALGYSDNGKPRTRLVAARLTWMARYGFIEPVEPEATSDRDPKHRLWAVTPVGRSLMGGRLNGHVEQALTRSDPGQALLLMRRLTTEGRSESVAAALRREFQRNAKLR